MISAIVYASNSGYTAQYAKMLGEATGLPVNDISQMHNPQPDQQVIYLGWVMADKCVGARKAMKFFDVRAMVRVGMGPGTKAAADMLHDQLLRDFGKEVDCFALQGGFDIKKLHGPFKWIMLVKCREILKNLEEKKPLNEAQQLTYDMAKKGASAVSAGALAPVVDWYKAHK